MSSNPKSLRTHSLTPPPSGFTQIQRRDMESVMTSSSSSASDLDGGPECIGGNSGGGGAGAGACGGSRRRRVSLDRDSARNILRSVVTFCPPNSQH